MFIVMDSCVRSPHTFPSFTDTDRGVVLMLWRGYVVMFPFSYSCSAFPADAETLMEAGLGVAKALRAKRGTTYQAGQACDLV